MGGRLARAAPSEPPLPDRPTPPTRPAPRLSKGAAITTHRQATPRPHTSARTQLRPFWPCALSLAALRRAGRWEEPPRKHGLTRTPRRFGRCRANLGDTRCVLGATSADVGPKLVGRRWRRVPKNLSAQPWPNSGPTAHSLGRRPAQVASIPGGIWRKLGPTAVGARPKLAEGGPKLDRLGRLQVTLGRIPAKSGATGAKCATTSADVDQRHNFGQLWLGFGATCRRSLGTTLRAIPESVRRQSPRTKIALANSGWR